MKFSLSLVFAFVCFTNSLSSFVCSFGLLSIVYEVAGFLLLFSPNLCLSLSRSAAQQETLSRSTDVDQMIPRRSLSLFSMENVLPTRLAIRSRLRPSSVGECFGLVRTNDRACQLSDSIMIDLTGVLRKFIFFFSFCFAVVIDRVVQVNDGEDDVFHGLMPFADPFE